METYTPAISTLPEQPEGPLLIDMEARVAGLVSTLRSTGSQVQTVFITGRLGSGELASFHVFLNTHSLSFALASSVWVSR
jgi:hypothetical protein